MPPSRGAERAAQRDAAGCVFMVVSWPRDRVLTCATLPRFQGALQDANPPDSENKHAEIAVIFVDIKLIGFRPSHP